MKIGIFSDVHGHLNELQQTLQLFKLLKVDQIVCAGDLVDKGNYSDAVVELMRELRIPCVQGNHDKKAQFTWLTHLEPLKDSTIEYLTNLPTSLTFEWEGKSIYICHANPWEDASYYLYPNCPEFMLQEVVKTCSADIVIMGHTHHAMFIIYQNRLLLNPGSIYGNRDRPERTCGVLSLPEGQFQLYNIDNGQNLSFS